jgi:hypothetical protein
MQKLLFLLFFGCLSANVWAQQPLPTSLEIAQMVLDFYTEPNFLDTLKVVENNRKDTVLFVVNDTYSNVILKEKEYNIFIWDKKTKNLTQKSMLWTEFGTLFTKDKQSQQFDVFGIYTNVDGIDMNMITYCHKNFDCTYYFRDSGCSSACQNILPNGEYKTSIITPLNRMKLKVIYSEDTKKNILVGNGISPCEASKEERRAFFARQYLK